MIRKNTSTQMPEQLLQQVQQVQKTKQSRDRRFAWLVGAAVLALTMLVAMIIESQLNLFSYWLRFGLTLVSLAATIICARTLLQRGKRDNERLLSAAKDVDAACPELKERVATLTSCEENRSDKHSAHPAMLNRLSQEASRIHQQARSKVVVSHRLFKGPLLCLAAAALVMLGMFLWDAPKTKVQLGRFWAPWANWSTTNVIAVGGDSVVARNEPIRLSASLSGRMVDEVELLSKQVDTSELSTTRLWPSTKDETVANFRQSKAVESFDFQFRAGDGQTEWHRVTVADRPKIEDLTMRIVPPAYTGRPARTFTKLPKKHKVVAGSRLEVAVKPKTHVRTARLVMGETDWLPMEPLSGGDYNCSFEPHQPLHFEVQLTELHGLQNRKPPHCYLQVVADKAPKVKILKPTKTAVLLPDESIDIHFKATDDHGIKKMALRVYTQRGDEKEATVHEVDIPIDPEKSNRKINGSVALDLAQFDLKDGDSIRYEVRASDNFVPMEDLGDPSSFQPMEAVELAQGETTQGTLADGQASTASNNAVDAPSSAGATDSNATQPSSQSNPDGTSSTENQIASNADNEADRSPAETGGNEKSQPDAADVENKANQKAETPQRLAADEMKAGGAQAQSQQPTGNAVADSASKGSTGEAGANKNQVGKAATPDSSSAPEKEIAASDKPDNPASNENKIQSSAEPDENAAKAPDASKVAQSNSPNKQNTTGKNSPASQAPSNSKPGSSAGEAQQANSSSSNQSSSPAAKENSSQPTKTAAKESKSQQQDPSKEQQDAGSPSAKPNQIAKSSADAEGQSSSSGQRKIKVDQYAGGFTTDHRTKLELVIEPTLKQLFKALTESGEGVRRVMNPTTEDPMVGGVANQILEKAIASLDGASKAVVALKEKTKNTPYAFVGLRLESIRDADVEPAWFQSGSALGTAGEARIKHAATAWNHINRALASLTELDEKYKIAKRDLKKADDILKFKKMYQIYIEKAMATIGPGRDGGNGQRRKGAEFDLDEEYLKRLKEVLQMRQEMMAELARILADDPQLLRRYMTRLNKRNFTIRDQLSVIAIDQRTLSQKVHVWANATENPAMHLDHHINSTEAHLSEVQELSNRVANLNDDFYAWLPLKDDVRKGDVAETVSDLRTAGSQLTEVVANVHNVLTKDSLRRNFGRDVKSLLEKANRSEQALGKVGQSLQRMYDNASEPELANNALRRLPTLQSIRRQMQQWIGKLELLRDDLVHEVYSVDQENRREELLRYNVKIASLESQLAAVLGNRDGQLPVEIADRTKELLKILDLEIPADQLVASQTLIDGTATVARPQQTSIVAKFEQAETTFSGILQAITDELDKRPVQDPIASLLEDPTLDQILAELERELDFFEELGISRRPTNVRIFGGARLRLMGKMKASSNQIRNLSNLAYRKAMDRARARNKKKKLPKLAKENDRWNVLAGKLGEDMLQGGNKVPPQRYRSAIDQYFEQISKLKNDKEN